MASKIVFLGVCALVFTAVSCRSLDKTDDQKTNEKEENEIILESLKEFVNMVEKYNLNVSVIGSERKYSSEGWTKEDMSLHMRMPVSTEYLTNATLDDDKQAQYLKTIEKLQKKDHLGAKTRVIQIEHGEDVLADDHEINESNLIDSPSYKALTAFKNGLQGFSIPENDTNQILYNYIITDPSSEVKNIQVLTKHIRLNEFVYSDCMGLPRDGTTSYIQPTKITELEVSKDFPKEILDAAKEILPKLWLSIDDVKLLSRLLAQNLQEKHTGTVQVIIGTDNFALHGKKFANLKVADSNVLIYV